MVGRTYPVVLMFLVGSLATNLSAVDLCQPLPWKNLPRPLAANEGVESRPEKGSSDWGQDVVELVNQERWDNGELPPLKRCDLLDSSSSLHSTNMGERDFFAHCDPDTMTEPWDRMVSAGYSWSYAGENIAAGQTSPTAVMATWMGSSGHRGNILSEDFRELGVGHFHDSGDAATVRRDLNGDCVADDFNNGPYFHYWTQNFGRRSNVYPVVINREAESTDTVDVDLYLYGEGWASEMRLRNDVGSWTDWQSFSSEVAWQLSTGAGTREVFVEIRSGSTVRSSSDSIVSNAAETDLIFADGFESGDLGEWSTPLF